MDRSRRQKINKDIGKLSNTTDQQFIIHINSLLHPATAECTFFPRSQGIFTKIDTVWTIKHTSTNLEEQKSYIVGSQTTVELN